MPSHLFVYGTLRPIAAQGFAEARDVLSKLEPYLRHVGEARVRGRLHWISWYPALVDSPSPRDRVFGDLLVVQRPDKVFPLLDSYENASTTKSRRCDYVRSRRLVLMASGDFVSAWVYVYNRPLAIGARIMSGDFLQASKGANLVVAPVDSAGLKRAKARVAPASPRRKGGNTLLIRRMG